jgi:pyruvate/2-oxoglutarate/acetoin dehydrogenase E1 component
MTQMMSYAEAFLTALEDCMVADASVHVIGRPFSLGPTRELANKLRARFADRVVDPPISEPSIAALGAGAAMAGLRPFVDLGTGSFSLLAFSQIVNEAPVAHYMSGGRLRAPVVYHCSHGVRGAGAPQHSHDMHGFLWNTPGLQLVMPATPADAYGLVRTALTSPNPSMILTHFKQFGQRGEMPDARAAIPFGQARIHRPGRDVTIVALSLMVGLALQAAEMLAAEGIDAEILDPRTLTPLDEDSILASVARTGRLVVVDETPLHGGVASGIAGMVAERGFGHLRAPVRRVARPNTPVPASSPMEAAIIPTVAQIVEAARRTVHNPHAA